MNKRIFIACFTTSLLAVLISVGLIFGVLFGQSEDQIFKELKSEATYIAHAVKVQGIGYIENFKGADKRITLVDSNGIVITDTSADASVLDNHLEREEIVQAMTKGSGESTRYSDTLMTKTLYYALRLDDGRILRVSATQSSVIMTLWGLVQPLILIILMAMAVSFFLSKRVSRAIVKPINNLDLENPSNNVIYDELTPLLRKMSAQKITIGQQIRDARQKQEEFRLITENMSEGLIITDAYNNVLTYNSAALKLLEIDKITSTNVLSLNRKRSFREALEKALSGERAQRTMTIEDKSYDIIATPVYEDGRIIGAVIVIVDVTEREQRDALRREFTANVSHELRTPLTSISGFAEMIKQGDMPMETVVDFSRSIYDEAQRLIGLVSDIIKITTMEEKGDDSEIEDVELFSLAEHVIGSLEPIAKKRGIQLSVEGDKCIVKGSGKIIKEIVYNLCDNAIKYNKENGKVIVTVTNGEKASIAVEDTGIGIPLAHRERIFERFYRVDKSHSKEIGGTGLGLSIVKHGVLFHNAEILLESSEGNGSKFTVIF
ncbi:MAG: PAS domain-containing protein [Clostridia bacterium]|nr:PAS domain-containing protein [Clostridia bacterium]